MSLVTPQVGNTMRTPAHVDLIPKPGLWCNRWSCCQGRPQGQRGLKQGSLVLSSKSPCSLGGPARARSHCAAWFSGPRIPCSGKPEAGNMKSYLAVRTFCPISSLCVPSTVSVTTQKALREVLLAPLGPHPLVSGFLVLHHCLSCFWLSLRLAVHVSVRPAGEQGVLPQCGPQARSCGITGKHLRNAEPTGTAATFWVKVVIWIENPNVCKSLRSAGPTHNICMFFSTNECIVSLALSPPETWSLVNFKSMYYLSQEHEPFQTWASATEIPGAFEQPALHPEITLCQQLPDHLCGEFFLKWSIGFLHTIITDQLGGTK